MKVFVGFGYNQRDAWIKELVFPLIEIFDGEVLYGEDIFGDVLTIGVKNRIDECDALLGFFTPSDEKQNGKFTTHDWVRDEYGYANGKEKKTIPFIEQKVDWNQGMIGNVQHIPFNEDAKDKLILKVVEVLCKLRRVYMNKRLRFLAPPEFITEIRPLINQGRVECTYRYMIGSWESPEMKAPLLKIAGGICIDLKNLPEDIGMVQVKVVAGNAIWSSDYESLEFLSINLSQG